MLEVLQADTVIDSFLGLKNHLSDLSFRFELAQRELEFTLHDLDRSAKELLAEVCQR